MKAQNHAKNNKPKLPSHKKETCSFIFLFNLLLPPHYLTRSACSQTCATCHLGENQVYAHITSNHTYLNRKAQI